MTAASDLAEQPAASNQAGRTMASETRVSVDDSGPVPWGPALSFFLLKRAEDTRFELVRV